LKRANTLGPLPQVVKLKTKQNPGSKAIKGKMMDNLQNRIKLHLYPSLSMKNA
jgi:hypothetical protein